MIIFFWGRGGVNGVVLFGVLLQGGRSLLPASNLRVLFDLLMFYCFEKSSIVWKSEIV